MSEQNAARDTQPMLTAGGMLRVARQAQGLHVAALATMLKVTPRKLEALESDRHEELQGPTFVRALAQAACRSLKIDPVPVLARLPEIGPHTLDRVSGGLNAPFREHGARRDLADLPIFSKGVVLTVLGLLAAAAALWFVPTGWKLPSVSLSAPDFSTGEAASAVLPSVPAATAPDAATPAPAPPAVTEAISAPPALTTDSGLRPDPVVPARLLQVKANAESWVGVVDGGGQSLLSRTLHPGETVDLDGALPLRVKIGNASGTELIFRGQVLDISSQTRENIARLELK
jgi:cytoskeleton protein RodZ